MRGSERKLLRETYYDTTLDFFYDHTGSPYAMSYQVGSSDPIIYYYILNLQGDVVMMVDADGDEVARYTYDAYGNILTATGAMADINPLRYRGYYYDAETGMYYLQSRYYDPVVGRFINADQFASTGQGFLGYNMFAYCLNNPVARSDMSGAVSDQFNDDTTDDLHHQGGSGKGGTGYGGQSTIGGNADYMSISTGRNEANNLTEQIAMESAKSNPASGSIIIKALSDTRFPSDFSKYQMVFYTSIGKIVIHYVGNALTGIFTDFKFKI